MASVSKRKNSYLIQWTPAGGGGRQSLYLSRVTKRGADSVAAHIDYIVGGQINHTPLPQATSHWLADQSDRLYQKLVRKGLAPPRGGGTDAIDCGAYFDKYIAARTDLEKTTVEKLKQTRKWFTKFFTDLRDIRTITAGDVADWHRFLKANLAAASADVHVKKARQVFVDAKDRKLITDNPFHKVKIGKMVNEDRMVRVPADAIRRVIDACPDVQWKLVFALARFNCLRIPSEIRRMTWADVQFERMRMTIHSQKTKRYEGHETRVVPIFPEVQPLLIQALAEAEEGERYVLPRLRKVTNLGTTANKIIARAGEATWVKTFQNLRSSCEVDWADRFVEHLVCYWAGHTSRTARRHYLRPTEEHYRAASQVAEAAGRHRQSNEHDKQNTHVSSDNANYPLAPEEPALDEDSTLNPAVLQKALQHALHRHAKRLSRAPLPPSPALPAAPPSQGGYR